MNTRRHTRPVSTHSRPWRTALPTLALVAVSLTGCVDTSMRDLERWTEEVMARPGGEIPPIPDLKPMPQFVYEEADRRSPFMPFLDPTEERVDNGIRPDEDRPREELEKFPLDALAMRGILQKQAQRYALVRDGDGVIHEVQVGNYMGLDYGRVIAIEENEIQLIEIVPDGQGGWREQPVSIRLRTD